MALLVTGASVAHSLDCSNGTTAAFLKKNIAVDLCFHRSGWGPRISKTGDNVNLLILLQAGVDGREHMHCYKAGQGIEPPGDSSLWVLLGKIEGAWSRGEEKLAPLWRGQGECWHLNSDGRVPAGNKRELNLKMRCGQAKNGSAGGWWPTSRENWWREFHSLSNLPRVGWALLKVLSLPYV